MDAFIQQALGRGHALLCARRIAAAVHGNELSQPEAKTHDGNLHQRPLEESGGAAGNLRDQCLGIEIRNVVGHEDASLAGRHVLPPL